MYKFTAADQIEKIVFGAAKPGYTNEQVDNWIQFMKGQGIQRVCCLLTDSELARYSSNLLETYYREFSINKVCWAPIEDFQLAKEEILTSKILPFLNTAVQQEEKVVVHCGGGIGRTGHILAAWLVNSRLISNRDAIAAVKRVGRNPYEAAIVALLFGKNPWKVVNQLNTLLDKVRQSSCS